MNAAAPEVSKVEPPNWWIGHSINPVRLLIRGRHLEGARAVADSPALQIGLTRVNAAGTYAFVDVSIARTATPGPYPLRLVTAGGEAVMPFEVLEPLARAGPLSGLLARRRHLPDHAGPLRQRRSVQRRSRGVARFVQPPEAALLPWRRLPGHRRSFAVPEGSRRHRHLGQPGVRQCQPPERTRAVQQPGHHRLSRLRRGGFLRRRGALRHPGPVPRIGGRSAPAGPQSDSGSGGQSHRALSSVGERSAHAHLVPRHRNRIT